MYAHEIPDTGLRLGVLNALLEIGRLDDEALRKRLAGIADEEYEEDEDDEKDEEDVRIERALERLRDVEIDPEALVEIERIGFDGGNDIYMLIEETIDVDTGGETDHYQLGSLAGIERFTGLHTLSLDGHGYRKADLDLGPLRGHPTLVTLSLTGRCTNVGALETIGTLGKLDVSYGGVDDEAALDRLAARGVTVTRPVQ